MNAYSSYRPQRSCGQGYVFTHVCDSVHGGVLRAAPLPPGTRQNPPPRDQAETPPPDQADPPPQEEDCSIRSMSGRYASYWNAFLLNLLGQQKIFLFCGRWMSCVKLISSKVNIQVPFGVVLSSLTSRRPSCPLRELSGGINDVDCMGNFYCM